MDTCVKCLFFHLLVKLSQEKIRDQLQFAVIRKKHVAKMLYDFNMCKPSFQKTLEDFDNLLSCKKKKIYSEVHVKEALVRIVGI